MSKQIEVLIDDQSKHIAPSRAQVEEALKGYDVVSILEVSARPNRQWLVVAEVNAPKKAAVKPKPKAAKPKTEAKPKAKKKSLIGSDSDSE